MNAGKTRFLNAAAAAAQNKKAIQGKAPTPTESNVAPLPLTPVSRPQQPEAGAFNSPQEAARKRPNPSTLNSCISKITKSGRQANDLPEDEILERRRNRSKTQAQLESEDNQDYEKLAKILKATRKEHQTQEAHNNDKISKLQNTCDNLKNSRDTLHQKVTVFEGDMKHIKETLNLKDDIIEKMEGIQNLSQENIKAKEEDIEKLKAELAKAQNRNEQNEKEIIRLRGELGKYEKQGKTLQDEFEKKKLAIKAETQKELSRILDKF